MSIAVLQLIGSDAILVQARVCLTAPIFASSRACGHQALARTPSYRYRARHITTMISLHRLACRATGHTPGGHRGTATPATEVQHNDHRNALGGNVLQKTPGSLWRKRKRATAPASAPKLRQNRIKCSSLRFKCNRLLYLNRGLPGSAVYDLSTDRHQSIPLR